tara:strand:- start:646 stop:1197 length:552 start_codon:yes stop_codon:yes gene_type:complete
MKVSEKFGLMSNEQFADYLYNNPGGASKAFLLRCEGIPSEEVRVEYRTEWKKEIEYRDRVVEKVVEKEVKVEVEKVVEKIKVPLWMRRVTGVSVLVAVGCMVMMPTGVVKEVIKKEMVEVPVEVVKEVEGPERIVEVIKEVKVVDDYMENKLRDEVEKHVKYIHYLHEQQALLSDALNRARFN